MDTEYESEGEGAAKGSGDGQEYGPEAEGSGGVGGGQLPAVQKDLQAISGGRRQGPDPPVTGAAFEQEEVLPCAGGSDPSVPGAI